MTILGGVRHGETQGGPVAIQVGNTEWPKWETVMSADPVDRRGAGRPARNAPLTRPRPGHADLVGMQKYDFDEARPILERASARETAARVALGRVATNFLQQAYGITLLSHVVELGTVAGPADGLLPTLRRPGRRSTTTRCAASTETSPRPCTPRSRRPRRTVTRSAAWSRWWSGACPPGLGSHVHWDRRLDAKLAGALMGIQAIKGVEVGDGFDPGPDPRQPGPRRDRARRRTASPGPRTGPAAPRAG